MASVDLFLFFLVKCGSWFCLGLHKFCVILHLYLYLVYCKPLGFKYCISHSGQECCYTEYLHGHDLAIKRKAVLIFRWWVWYCFYTTYVTYVSIG